MAAVKQMRGKGRRKASSGPVIRRPESPLDRAKAYEVTWNEVAPLFDAARPIQNPSFTYAIGEEGDGPVKIGVAKDPIKRLRSMQTGNPRRLRVERVLIGDMAIEKLLHEMWESFAIVAPHQRRKVDAPPGTEWFRGEIRESLFPILETACSQQIAHVEALGEDCTLLLDDMERIVRGAHGVHGFVAHKRHEVRLLGAGGGYYTPRRSRI